MALTLRGGRGVSCCELVEMQFPVNNTSYSNRRLEDEPTSTITVCL